jgi:hypothetical protein
MPLPLLGLAGAGINLVSGLITAGKQKKLANAIHPNDPTYQTSDYAKNNLALASQLYNSRMAGANQQEQNIYGTQANTISAIDRNSGSGADALAAVAGTQGNTNQSFANLGMQEAQDKMNRYALVNQANQGMINEGDKVYNDQLRKYTEAVDAKNALQGAALQNSHNAIAGFGNMLGALGQQQSLNKQSGNSSFPQSNSFGQFAQMAASSFNPNQGASPAAAFGNVAFNPMTPTYSPFKPPQYTMPQYNQPFYHG